jgi:cytochrome c biogenesis protein CcdA
MIGRMASRDASRDDASVRSIGTDLLRLVLAYAKQETLDPVKALGRYVLWGLLGAVLISSGVVLVGLAAVRAAQTEAAPHLGGNLSWVPYCAGALVAIVVVALAASRIARAPR